MKSLSFPSQPELLCFQREWLFITMLKAILIKSQRVPVQSLSIFAYYTSSGPFSNYSQTRIFPWRFSLWMFICFNSFSQRRDNVVSIMTRLKAGHPMNNDLIPGRSERFTSSPKRPDSLLRSTEAPVKWVLEALSLGWRQLDLEACQSPPSGGEIKNERSYTSIPLQDFLSCKGTTHPYSVFLLQAACFIHPHTPWVRHPAKIRWKTICFQILTTSKYDGFLRLNIYFPEILYQGL